MSDGYAFVHPFLVFSFLIPQANLQAGKLPVTTNSDLVVVTGPANRLLLTKEILNFCGALPIYHTELSPWNSTEREFDPSNGNASESTSIKILI